VRRLRTMGPWAGIAGSLLAGSLRAGSAHAATSTAAYSVRFDATWSATSHPFNFPASAHFSALIGGTHNGAVQVWAQGALASAGIRDMAERGLTAPLAAEVQTAINAGQAGMVILGGAVAPSPGIATATFTATQSFSRVSLVTMIAPSPDWFVGVSALELFTGGEWRDQVTVPLFAYDAGTDSGTDYTSANQVTAPPVPIAPNGAVAFQNGTPVGLFTFTRTDGPNPTAVPAAGTWGRLALTAFLLCAAGWALSRRARLHAAWE